MRSAEWIYEEGNVLYMKYSLERLHTTLRYYVSLCYYCQSQFCI